MVPPLASAGTGAEKHGQYTPEQVREQTEKARRAHDFNHSISPSLEDISRESIRFRLEAGEMAEHPVVQSVMEGNVNPKGWEAALKFRQAGIPRATAELAISNYGWRKDPDHKAWTDQARALAEDGWVRQYADAATVAERKGGDAAEHEEDMLARIMGLGVREEDAPYMASLVRRQVEARRQERSEQVREDYPAAILPAWEAFDREEARRKHERLRSRK